MIQPFVTKSCKVTLNKEGSRVRRKMSFPVHCGIYSEIDTSLNLFHFNLNHEIVRVKTKGSDWAHPHEWLKHTRGDDWVYYSTGGYAGVFEATGEYYLPNFRYPTNSILGGHPFAQEEISQLADTWHSKLSAVAGQLNGVPPEISHFFERALDHSPQHLQARAHELTSIIGGRISVLPPDARHVDYDIVPLTISRGCLYKCRFCKVKNTTAFTELTAPEISRQIASLKTHYGDDLFNYNSLFLGEHDALQASSGCILSSINEAYRVFDFQQTYPEGCNTFFFGSITSLLGAEELLFQELDALPGQVYINIGLESADQETLRHIGKPVVASDVIKAFRRMQEINNRYPSVELTGNFIMDEDLPPAHYTSILELIRDSLPHTRPKGAIYFSPLRFDQPSRKRLFEFNRLKLLSRLPTYLYIIQRL